MPTSAHGISARSSSRRDARWARRHGPAPRASRPRRP